MTSARSSGAHRPANDTPGEQINDGRDKEPAFRGPDIREVSDPFAVGSGGFKVAVEHVGRDGARLPLTQIGRQAAPAGRALNACSRINRSIRCNPHNDAFG